jgi:hypothetical protein
MEIILLRKVAWVWACVKLVEKKHSKLWLVNVESDVSRYWFSGLYGLVGRY